MRTAVAPVTVPLPPATRAPALAPFAVRSFRFQWPSDLAASWAFEMETLILGWYVLVESGSVKLLVLFGALQYAGALVSPLFGVAGDRVGNRRLLWLTRGLYALLALLLAVLAAANALTPLNVLAISAVIGLVRPSDLMMRYALIAQTLPAAQLLGALGVSRVTSDSARIAGALAGAAAVSAYGIAPAYAVIALLYLASFALSLGVAGHASAPAPARRDEDSVTPGHPATDSRPGSRSDSNLRSDADQANAASRSASPLQDLFGAFRHVRQEPALLGAMTLAFLVNLLAFPFVLGLLPFVARNVYGVGQAELGFMVAAYSLGALIASLVLAANRFVRRPARTMIAAALCWFVLQIGLALTSAMPLGLVLLLCIGFAQSLCLTPLAAVMLQACAPAFRGRVMGMRLLAVLGLPLGLLLAGPLIDVAGLTTVTLGYAALGLGATAWVIRRWHTQLWRSDARANLG